MSSYRISERANIGAISWQSGVPADILDMVIQDHTPLGIVEAETKGAALVLAHEKFPHVPVAMLHIERIADA